MLISLVFLTAASVWAVNPMHLKDCQAQLLGLDTGELGASDYRSISISRDLSLGAAFQRLYYTDIHAVDFCGANVGAFLRYMQERGIDVSEAKVLYLTNPIGGLRGRLVRGVTERAWDFHVVILWKNRVLDFSYANAPREPSVAEYFEKMLGSDPNVLAEEIPVDAYLGRAGREVRASSSSLDSDEPRVRMPFAQLVARARAAAEPATKP